MIFKVCVFFKEKKSHNFLMHNVARWSFCLFFIKEFLFTNNKHVLCSIETIQKRIGYFSTTKLIE